MPWVNLDDGFPSHPKVIRLSDSAFRLHVAGICYCNKHRTDGVIDADMAPLLVPRYRAKTLTELLDRGLWERHVGVYKIHDYLDWNRSKAEIEVERERLRKVRSDAGKKGARARWGA